MSIPALLATFGVMAVLDGIWLTVVARSFYRDNIGHLIGDATNWPPAIAFYVIYTVGAWFFATQPGVDDGSVLTGALRGAAFGFVAFYVIYTAGAWFFATQPGVDDGSVLTGALRGAAFGFVAYATYDLTNHATLRNWPTVVTVVDMAWGTALTATVAGVATWITLSLAG